MKRKEADKKMDDGIEEPLTYCDFSNEHWTFIRTNKVVERLNREIRAVSGSRQFPRRQLCPHADPCPAAPCGLRSMGPQEVQKHDALGGSHRLVCCWLTSFIPDSENYLTLPLTQSFPTSGGLLCMPDLGVESMPPKRGPNRGLHIIKSGQMRLAGAI